MYIIAGQLFLTGCFSDHKLCAKPVLHNWLCKQNLQCLFKIFFVHWKEQLVFRQWMNGFQKNIKVTLLSMMFLGICSNWEFKSLDQVLGHVYLNWNLIIFPCSVRRWRQCFFPCGMNSNFFFLINGSRKGFTHSELF